MNTSAPQERSPAGNDADAQAWSLRFRWLVSGLLALHLLGVLAFPFFFATRTGPQQDPSPLGVAMMRVLQPYVDAAYLHHGYFFFAPNPGSSHLFRARLEYPDGRVEEQLYPDLDHQWPRLLYHRHFMLAESLHNRFEPSQPPPQIADDPFAMQRWREQRALYVRMRQSFANHLRHVSGAEHVELIRLEHRPPTPYEVLELKMSLDDPRLYRELPEDTLPPGGPLQ